MAAVMVLITRHVRPGRGADYAQIIAGLTVAAARYPGHLGGHLFRPGDQSDSDAAPFHLVFAFDTDEHLHAWNQSPEREKGLAQMESLICGADETRVLSGLERWFALPAQPNRPPPPRWKMAVVTWFGIFPLVLLLSTLIAPLLAPVHPGLSVAVVTVLVVVCMTWFVAPTLTRLFAGWLYPAAASRSPY